MGLLRWPRRRPVSGPEHIQVRVPTVEHIFNPMDPAPLEWRSLNTEVAEWIEEWAEDIDHRQPLTVEFHVADGRLAGYEQAVVDGLHHHFEYRESQAERQFGRVLRDGRISLVIGLAALAAFTTASRVIGTSDDAAVDLAHEGLAILGWVSMWKPIDIFLYEWWPIRRERRACHRLAVAEVSFPRVPSR